MGGSWLIPHGSNNRTLALIFKHISYDIDRQRIQRVFKDTP